jgi:peroxiredoxin
MKDKPFALIGVNINCHDPKTLKRVMDKERLTFRSFTDRSDGEGLGVIGSAWNLFGTPTVFVLDHKGAIRYRQIGIPDKKAIDEVLTKLIKEAKGNDKKEQ